ncbi:MAG: BTAD domain-containing putative transcriptional regulator [Gaiellaceae bacterium]
MEFRILGPLEVVEDGRPISIRRGKEQALLAYLLLHANEVVPSGTLIDVLWDERPPTTASKILQNGVSHLRKQLGNGRLVTRDPGYLLRVEKDELDLEVFARLAREGRETAALALWRGTPLLDLRDERFADEARRRLEEQRLAVIEDRVDADLSAGRHADLIPELESLVAANPLRERLVGQLMLALYRAGRQTDALEVYQRARRRLSEELGLEPGPQLQELERRILTHDPELAGPPSGPRRAAPQPRRPRKLLLFGVVAAVLVAAAAFGLSRAFSGSATPVVQQNSLVVVDPSGNRVVGVVPVGHTPRGVAVGRDYVWVANSADGTISQIGRKSLKTMQTIGLGEQATDLVESAGSVWVATGIDDGLVQLDARSGGIQERLHLSSTDQTASAHAVTAGAGAIWVASGARLLKVNPKTGAISARKHNVGCCFGGVNDVAVGGGSVWIADVAEVVYRASEADLHQTGRVDLGVIPGAVTFAFGSPWVALPATFGRRITLAELDPQTVQVLDSTPIGPSVGFPPTMELTSGAGDIWVTNFSAGTLVRVDPRSGVVKATIHLGHHPFGVAFGANRIWVTIS